MVGNHVEHGQHRSGADAHDGPRRAYLQALPDMDEVPRQRQAHHQLKKRLNKLAGCRRHHVLLPLGKAPVGTHDGYTYHRNAQAFDGPVGQGVVHGRSQLPGKKQHNGGAHSTHNSENTSGGVETPAHLGPPSGGVGLADELGEGQRQSGGGEGQEEGVNVVGAVEVGETLVAQNIVQRDFVQCAADLDEHGGDGHHRDTAHKGLLFFSGHGISSFFLKCGV